MSVTPMSIRDFVNLDHPSSEVVNLLFSRGFLGNPYGIFNPSFTEPQNTRFYSIDPGLIMDITLPNGQKANFEVNNNRAIFWGGNVVMAEAAREFISLTGFVHRMRNSTDSACANGTQVGGLDVRVWDNLQKNTRFGFKLPEDSPLQIRRTRVEAVANAASYLIMSFDRIFK